MAVKNKHKKTQDRIKSYLSSRTHRSFRRTRRRDYIRTLKLPGYFSFTKYVATTIWKYRKTFVLLAVLYAIFTIVMVGIGSQDLYSTISNTLNTTSGNVFTGVFGEIGKSSLLFATAATGGISQTLSEAQQVYAGIIFILTWMTSVWLLRNLLAGHKVKMRDGLYSAGAPIVSTFLIALVFIVQLLPLALAVIGYSAASATGLLAGGVEAMLFWIAALLLVLLSLYWVTSTFFALIIVTLPGMYPYQALKTASDLVVGRRLRILLRLVWMFFVTIVAWAIVMIPVIILDSWIKSLFSAISGFPTVPLTLLILGAITVIWISSYVYLLYRKVVDDETNPA
ncbi:MAG TPA: hypothetical protein VMR16_03480 [Candidatus Saccharimonadales bacterium]|jgi:hypothetical protein|nr:hypothetical protein [Candidatus Saccharimonadales bacterium]